LDLCLSYRDRVQYEEHFLEWIMKEDSSSDVVIDGLLEKIAPYYRVENMDIVQRKRFEFPSHLTIVFQPNAPLNKNLIRLFAFSWFKVQADTEKYSSPMESIESMILLPPWILTPPLYEEKKIVSIFKNVIENDTNDYWYPHAHIASIPNTTLFEISHPKFIEAYVQKMTQLMEKDQLPSLLALSQHPLTKRMKKINIINAGRVLFQIKNKKHTFPTMEHFFSTGEQIKYIVVNEEENLLKIVI